MYIVFLLFIQTDFFFFTVHIHKLICTYLKLFFSDSEDSQEEDSGLLEQTYSGLILHFFLDQNLLFCMHYEIRGGLKKIYFFTKNRLFSNKTECRIELS